MQKANEDAIDDKTEPRDVEPDREGEHEMMFEDLEAEFVDMPVLPRARPDAACVRKDAAEIANGAQLVFLCEFPESQGVQTHCASSDVPQLDSSTVPNRLRHHRSARDRRRRIMASHQRS